MKPGSSAVVSRLTLAVGLLFGSGPLIGQLSTLGSQYWTQESPGFLETAQDGAQLGSSFAVGDFNADGYDDLAVGAPWYDYISTPSILDNGAVFVLRGGPNGLQTTTGHSRPLVIATRLGAALASGDFDGNGYDDLAMGAPNATADGVANAGVVWVLSSGPAGFIFPGQTITAGVYSTPQSGAAFGLSLAVGNFNGDGYDDLVIGEPYWDSSGPALANRGRVAILVGSATGLVTTSAWEVKPEPFTEVLDDALFGFSLAVGDFDGNGLDDLAVGAPLADDQTFGSCSSLCDIGKIAAYWSTGSLLAFDTSFWFTDIVTASPLASDLFGHTLAAGDVNGDGKDDLVVGSPFKDPSVPFPDRGEARAVFGSAGGIDLNGSQFVNQNAFNQSPANEDRFGFALAAADFNQDGRADLAAATPGAALGGAGRGWAGVAYAGPGGTYGSAGYQRFYQGMPGIPDSGENGDEFGRAVATGDFDGDCRPDLVIGVPYENVLAGQQDEGAFHVIYSRDMPFRDGFESGSPTCWSNY